MLIELWHKNGEWAEAAYKCDQVPAVGDTVYEVMARKWFTNKVVYLIVEEV
jgi:hypothetical protein